MIMIALTQPQRQRIIGQATAHGVAPEPFVSRAEALIVAFMATDWQGRRVTFYEPDSVAGRSGGWWHDYELRNQTTALRFARSTVLMAIAHEISAAHEIGRLQLPDPLPAYGCDNCGAYVPEGDGYYPFAMNDDYRVCAECDRRISSGH